MQSIDASLVTTILNELKSFSSRRYEILSEVSKTDKFYEEANQLVSAFSIQPHADTHADLRASKLEKACPVYAHYQQVMDSLMIAHTQHLWDTMFTSCSTDDGKHLSRKDRTAMRNSSSTLIYGEIAYDSYCHIMWSALADLEEEQTLDESAVAALEGTDPYARSRHAKGGVYYDLGSGTGRALLASVIAHSFHKVVGIEILSSLHEAAEKCLSVYQDMAARGEVPSRAVELVCGSFFDYDWSDGDVVFANSTCYSDEMFLSIARQCAALRDGALVITFSEQLQAPYLRLLALKNYKMSWGDASVYIHRKIGAPAPVNGTGE